MAQLRERREDFLHARAAEVDRELGALADPFARHDYALSELGMDHAHPDRASLGTAHGCRVLPPAPARDGRSRDPGRALPVEALRRDLAQEARGSSARRVPGAAEVGVEEIHATLGPGERDVEEAPLLLELRWIVQRRRARKKSFLESQHEHDREL